MSKILWFLIVSIFLPYSFFASEVFLNVDIGDNNVFYNYSFYFNSSENLPKTFSFAKPENSKFIVAKTDSGQIIRPRVAGDFFIIDTLDGVRSYSLFFESPILFEEFVKTNSFSSYVNLVLDFDLFVFRLNYPEGRQIKEVIPRSYVPLGDGSLEWEFKSSKDEMFFLIRFDDLPEGSSTNSSIVDKYLILFVSFLILILILLIYLFKAFILPRVSLSKKAQISNEVAVDKNNNDNLEKVVVSENNSSLGKVEGESNGSKIEGREKESKVEESEKNNKINLEKGRTEEEKDLKLKSSEEKLKEFMETYLTEKERRVVEIVKDNEGILQHEILEKEPMLSKSNLSKIVTKLHSKKILERIKVGKLNRIKLGEVLLEILEENN